MTLSLSHEIHDFDPKVIMRKDWTNIVKWSLYPKQECELLSHLNIETPKYLRYTGMMIRFSRVISITCLLRYTRHI